MTVYETLGDLDFVIDQLAGQVEMLENAISPVLAPSTPRPTANSPTAVPCAGCDAAQRVASLAERVRHIRDRVQDMEQRAQVTKKIDGPAAIHDKVYCGEGKGSASRY